MRTTAAVCTFVIVALCVGAAGAYPPAVAPEPPYTTDLGGQNFNTVFWSSTGAPSYRVRCLIAGADSGVAFQEPQFTRGSWNRIYVARPDLIEWTPASGTSYAFQYPEAGFPFSYLLHGRLVRYQVNSVPDDLGTFGEATSTQDNQGPWIPPQTFTCTDLHAGSTGNATGSVQITDWPAGVMRAYVIWDYGSGNAGEAAMPAIGGDYYSFSIPPPGGGWGGMAGGQLRIRVHGVDNAAEPDGTGSSYWDNESWTDFFETVEAAGVAQVPVWWQAGERPVPSSETPPADRSTTFRLQWSFDQNFGSIQGQADATVGGTYGSIDAGGLVDGGAYWFRVGFQEGGQFRYGEPTLSIADYQIPQFASGSWTVQNLNETSTGPWTGSLGIVDVELEYEWGPYVFATLDYRIGQNPTQTVALTVPGNPPGSPAAFSFSVPAPPGGWSAYAGQSINSMVVKAWDSAAPPEGFGPNIGDNTNYFYPPNEVIEVVRPTIDLLSPQPSVVYQDSIRVIWNATDDQVPGGVDPDGDETQNLTILLSYKRTPQAAQWTQIAQIQNTAAQPDSFLWNIAGLMEGAQYALRAIARDPSSFADTAIVQPFTVNRPDTPSIALIQPNGGELILGVYTVKWRATDPDSLYGEPNISLRIDGWYSASAGSSWQTMPWASHLNDGEELWDTSALEDGTQYKVKLRVTDPRGLWAEDVSDGVFTIDNNDPPDSVVLIAPNGGETWYGTRTVRWYAHDPDVQDTLRIKLNYRRYDPQNPYFWNVIAPDAGDLPNTGQYVWTVPSYLQGWYEMQVVAIDRGGLARSDTCDAPFVINSPDPPTVQVIAPNGEEFWTGVQTVRWSATDPDLQFGDTLAIAVEVSPDSGATWLSEAQGLPNTGSYLWDTDQPAYPDGARYLIRVCATDTFIGTTVCDVSDAPFYVLNDNAPPSVQVLYPNGGESVRNEVLVRWLATDPDTTIADTLAIGVSFSADSGATWTDLVSGLANTGSWLWDIRTLDDGDRYMVRVSATDRQGVTARDRSDGPFSIFNDPDNPTVHVVSPNGGEHWSGVREVRWEADDPDLFVGDTLAATVWVDSGAAAGFQPLLLADGIAGVPGRYVWDTAAWGLPDGDWYRVRVRVTDTDSLSATDESDGPFLLFNNNDSPTITVLAPTEGDIWKGMQTIRWTAADPDLVWGDTLAVSLYVRSSPGGSWVPIVLGMANTGVRQWDTQSVADGLTYQIRAVVKDTSWATGEAVSGTFAVENVNEPPRVFDLVAPAEGSTVVVFKPLMVWNRAVDIDAGDRVAYEVVYWPEGAQPARVPAGFDTTLTDTEWPAPLLDDTRYFWYVDATDSLGPATTTSRQTWWFVTNVDGNDSPQPFNLLSPPDGALLHPDSVVFRWTASFDEDVLDTLSYEVLVGTRADLSDAEVVPAGGALSWAMRPLTDNTTYFWAVRAHDLFGASRRSEELWHFTTDRGNDGPTPFSLRFPPEGTVLSTAQRESLSVRWYPSSDPDPLDAITYAVVLVDSIHPSDPSWVKVPMTLAAGETVALNLWAALDTIGFHDNRIYRWHVVATDSRGLSTPSSQTWWFATNDADEPPLVFDLLSPCDGCTLSTALPRMCWEAALDPDPLDVLTYRLEYDVDPLFPTGVVHPGLTATCWEPAEPFRDRGTVYWRVYAIDAAGLETRCRDEWEFVILPQATLEGLINYPNPFAAGREITRIQYILKADARVEIKIYDLLGDPVWRWSCGVGGEGGRTGTNVVEWDGRNEAGKVVANGGYLCVVKATPAGGRTAEGLRKIAVMK